MQQCITLVFFLLSTVWVSMCINVIGPMEDMERSLPIFLLIQLWRIALWLLMSIQPHSRGITCIFGMAAMPFLCNGNLLFQGNLPRILPVTIFINASCLIPYIISFLILCGQWLSLVFKDFQKHFCFQPNVFFSVCCNCFEDCKHKPHLIDINKAV